MNIMKKKGKVIKQIINHDLVQLQIIEFIKEDKMIKPEDVFEGYKNPKSTKSTKSKKKTKKEKCSAAGKSLPKTKSTTAGKTLSSCGN